MGKLEDYKLKALKLFELPEVDKKTKEKIKEAVVEFHAKLIKIKNE